MVRRYLFLGLMLALIAVIVSLVVKGRQQERKQAKAAVPVEIVSTSPPTDTRVLAPADLEVIESRPAEPTRIRNRGRESYRNVMLRITYLGKSGKTLGTKELLVPATIQPDQAVAVEDLDVPGAPSGWSRRVVRVLYAEIAPR